MDESQLIWLPDCSIKGHFGAQRAKKSASYVSEYTVSITSLIKDYLKSEFPKRLVSSKVRKLK